jgi:O-antigen ligase
MDTTNGRISLTASGTIGNSNDLAAHLFLVLPFLLFVAIDRKRSLFIRIPVLLGLAYGLRVILGTASRGAFVALFVAFLFMLWQASGAQRILALGGGVAVAVIFLVALPAMTRSRLNNLFGAEHIEAQESEDVRSYLFKQSLLFTIQHPVFGVGPGEFSNFEGQTRIEEGQIGVWRDPHFIYTQVSADCGIPALIFYVCGLGSAILAVFRTHLKARQLGNVEIANACFCYLLAMVGFLVAGSLLPFAYHFYYPTMIGLAGAISIVGARQLEASAPAATLGQFPAIRTAGGPREIPVANFKR